MFSGGNGTKQFIDSGLPKCLKTPLKSEHAYKHKVHIETKNGFYFIGPPVEIQMKIIYRKANLNDNR